MKGSKILFDDKDYDFIIDYKDATGVSMQGFVTLAVKEKIQRLEIEHTLRDQSVLKGESELWDNKNYNK